MTMKRDAWATTLLAVALITASCAKYEAPPEVHLVPPEAGVYVAGDSLDLEFSAPIDPATLVIQVWSGERDVEFEMTATEAILKNCTVATAPCGSTELSVAEDGMSATIQFSVDDLGKADVPYVLEVTDALTDVDGVRRGTSAWFDYQFKPGVPSGPPPEEPVDFTDGYYVIVAEVDEPMPSVISLVTHIIALDDGSIALVAGEADELPGAPKGSLDPTELIIDVTDQGFAVFGKGVLYESEEGRFMETDPFQVNISILGLQIILNDTRLTGKLIKNEETMEDTIDGILSYSGITLIGVTGEENYPAGSTQFDGVYVKEAEVPDGAPHLCDGLCGALTAQCEPPADFPGAEFCADSAP